MGNSSSSTSPSKEDRGSKKKGTKGVKEGGVPKKGAALTGTVAPIFGPLFHYDAEAKEWMPTERGSSETARQWPDAVRVVSFNVWFDALYMNERWTALLELVASKRPHLICFQEVIPPFVELLSQHPGVRSDYYVSEVPRNMYCSYARRYGEMLLIHRSLGAPEVIEFEPLPSSMGRRLLHASWPVADEGSPQEGDGEGEGEDADAAGRSSAASMSRAIHIGSVHLESLDSAPVRKDQLKVVQKVQARSRHAIVTGDFNFCAYRNFQGSLPLENDNLREILPDYVDVWEALNGRPTDEALLALENQRRLSVRNFELSSEDGNSDDGDCASGSAYATSDEEELPEPAQAAVDPPARRTKKSPRKSPSSSLHSNRNQSVVPDEFTLGYTFDSRLNKNIRIGAGDAPGQASQSEVWRIDRMMLKSPSEAGSHYWKPVRMEVIGRKPFQHDGRLVWPSDHFGLYAEFEYVS